MVLYGRPLPEYAAAIRCLDECGAQQPFVVCNGETTADLRGLSLGGVFAMDFGYLQEGLVRRTAEEVLESPPRELVEALDAYDPDRSAIVLSEGIGHHETSGGRRVADATADPHPSWEELVARNGVDPVPRTLHDLADLGRAAATADLGYGAWVWGQPASESAFGTDCYWIPQPADEDAGGHMSLDPLWLPSTVGVTPHLGRPILAVSGFSLPDGSVTCGIDRLWPSAPAGGGKVTAFPGPLRDPATVAAAVRDTVDAVGGLLRERGFVGPFTVTGYDTAANLRPLSISFGSTESHARVGEAVGIPWILLAALLSAGEVPARVLEAALRATPRATTSIAKLNVAAAPATPLRWQTENQQEVIWAGAPEGGVLLVRGTDDGALNSPIPSFNEGIQRWGLPEATVREI